MIMGFWQKKDVIRMEKEKGDVPCIGQMVRWITHAPINKVSKRGDLFYIMIMDSFIVSKCIEPESKRVYIKNIIKMGLYDARHRSPKVPDSPAPGSAHRCPQ